MESRRAVAIALEVECLPLALEQGSAAQASLEPPIPAASAAFSVVSHDVTKIRRIRTLVKSPQIYIRSPHSRGPPQLRHAMVQWLETGPFRATIGMAPRPPRPSAFPRLR